MNQKPETAAKIGPETIVEPGVVVGYRYHKAAGPAIVGAHGILRMGTIIYGDVVLGDYFQTGHNTIIRAKVRAGNYCTVYNQSTLEGIIRLGDGVRIMSHVYIPSRTWIGSHVFIGPGCTFLNEKKPCRYDTPPTPVGATIEDDVMIGGGCTIMAGVKIGEGSFIAAGAVVIEDIPPWSLAKGVPAKIGPLPEHLRRRNCRALTIQPLDFWHPKSPGSALPTWPASWKIETP